MKKKIGLPFIILVILSLLLFTIHMIASVLYDGPITRRFLMDDTSALFQSETFSFYGNVDGWYFIGYQDNISHAYFGYVTAKAFPLTERELKISTCCFDSVSLMASTDTYLTDDPVFSQERYRMLPFGTRIIGLSGFSASYVYAEVTIDGETIRGFVPIRDLALTE